MKKIKSINVIKIGAMVKISLDGKLHQKNCGTVDEANELFRLSLKAKKDPSDENIKHLHAHLNEKLRVAILTGLENDPETGEVFLAGFNTPIPTELLAVIKDYHENNFPLDPIINFWKLLMLNPDTRVRKSLFNFITTHDFSLTDTGYMIVYKAVNRVKTSNGEKPKDNSFPEFISKQYLHVKKDWKTNPKRYVVYKKNETNSLHITKKIGAEKWDEKQKNIEILGNLDDLFNAIYNTETAADDDIKIETPVYTDMYSGTIRIELGVPVKMERKDCDGDPANECSFGHHVGATKYVENFAGGSSIILACLISPTNVVAVPNYDHSKMRVSEYFPFAVATYENKKIDIIEQQYFESDYTAYEASELERQIIKIKLNDLPIETAIKAEKEERPMSELLKIIESRLVDLE